jgi:hypothetical protein
MTTPYQPDHASEATGELLSQFLQPSAVGFVTGLMDPVQGLEDDLRDLRADRLLSTAIGVQLDRFGDLVGEIRGALTDDEYRQFIASRIRSNLCGGSPDELITIFSSMAGPALPGTVVVYNRIGWGPAYSLTISRATALSGEAANRVRSQMADVNPAGVGQQLLVSVGAAPFRFNSGPGFGTGRLVGAL